MSLHSGHRNASLDATKIADAPERDLEKSPEEDQTSGVAKKPDYPTGLNLFLILFCLCATVFLVALDATIIANAIPVITSKFNSLGDIAWYTSSYFLATCAFQLPFGRAYALLGTKWIFVSALCIFEVGSAICGAAPTSLALIIGRAIQGIGGSGIFGGALMIIAENTPLQKRSLFMGCLGAIFAIASVVGPLLGGAFTIKVSWRWCFYINLPIGAVALAIVITFLPNSVGSAASELKGKTWWQILKRFDPIGTLLLIPCVVCLLLALQWGGTVYPWSSPRVIATFTCFGVLLLIWAALQYYQGDEATVPWSIVCQRSVVGATGFTLLLTAAFTGIIYYLPIWFQAIRQDNAEQSGIHGLPLILCLVVFSLGAGGVVMAIGYYTPFIILGSILCSVGAGLFVLLKPDSSAGEWIGYQILFAAGVGMSLEQCNVAVQTVLPEDKVPAGISLAVLARSIGGAVSIAICQNVFEQKLQQGLRQTLPDLDPSIVSGSGATNLITNVQNAVGGDQAIVKIVLSVYNDAVVKVFLVALILSAMTLPFALLVEWKSVKKEKKGKNGKDELDEDKSSTENVK